MVILHNVIDTRTEQFHSIAIVKQKNAKYFIEADRIIIGSGSYHDDNS